MIDFSKVEIRLMSFTDLEQIKDKLQSDYDDFWNYDILKEELGNTNSKYLVLLYEKQITCFGGVKIILDEANIMNIVTRKDMRNFRFWQTSFISSNFTFQK